ncbi:MAG: hypothetical protein RL497_2557 [Pseudomonadota bacterium]
MAENATIHKLNLTLSDLDREVYGEYNLTLAQHPSETIERMMVRVLAFCFRAAENLVFTKGLSSVEEPALWLKHDNGTLLEWIEVGQPAPERIKKASNQSQAVYIFSFGRGVDVWWKSHADAIKALPKVTTYMFAADEIKALCTLVDRTMKLTVTITEGTVYVANATENVTLALVEK